MFNFRSYLVASTAYTAVIVEWLCHRFVATTQSIGESWTPIEVQLTGKLVISFEELFFGDLRRPAF